MQTRPEPLDHRRNTLLWLGMLGPPVVWIVYLAVAYLLILFARRTGHVLPLHVASAVFLALALGAGGIAWSQWRRARRSSPQAIDEAITARARFMSLIGMLASVEFSLLIAASWAAMFILNPWHT
jgi:hypothetical protein